MYFKLIGIILLVFGVSAQPSGNNFDHPKSDILTNKEVKKTILPDDAEEICFNLEKGQRITYSFSSSEMMEFNIHFHVGQMVFYPVRHNNPKVKNRIFTAKADQEYCLMWVNHTSDTIELQYKYGKMERE